MELSHTPAAIGAAFDDPNLIASAGLVPLIALAEFAGLLDSIQDMSILFTRALGHGKQGASFGYSGVRGLNASAATVTAPGGAPVIARTRLRKGSANSAKGAERIAADPPTRHQVEHPGRNRHPEHRYASDRTRARNDNQRRNASPIGAFRLSGRSSVSDGGGDGQIKGV